MYHFGKQKWKFFILLFVLLLSACDDLIIKDDGKITLGLEDCEGVAFMINVNQGSKNVHRGDVKVEDGVLQLDVSKGNFDFDKTIKVEVHAVGPGAQACGIAFSETLVFNGIAEPVAVKDHKISLSDFKKRP